MKLSTLFNQLKAIIAASTGPKVAPPIYRIVEITQPDGEEYLATIQLINKNSIFKMKPSEILARDDLVDLFSPRDIRTLTYLGYLQIKHPEYKILANRLSEQNDKMLFALQKKGERTVVIKTAAELTTDTCIEKFSPKDAHLIGYTAASESIQQERIMKEKLLQQLTSQKTETTPSAARED